VKPNDTDYQVVFGIPIVTAMFEAWVEANGWRFFPIPNSDDFPTYGIGPSQEQWNAAMKTGL
jgi:hypothetical protein